MIILWILIKNPKYIVSIKLGEVNLKIEIKMFITKICYAIGLLSSKNIVYISFGIILFLKKECSGFYIFSNH